MFFPIRDHSRYHLSMSTLLKDKVAVVTGGTRGIGLAIAETLLRAGARVAVCSREAANVEKATAELSVLSPGNVVGRTADVADPKSVAKFFSFVAETFGGVNILVNNAGLGIFRAVADLSIEDWHTVLRTNLDGVFYCCHEAIGRMKQTGGGTIINISSLAGKNPFAGGAAYNASKFALNGFSEAMMLDHREDNIRVSYIMPGSVDTGFNHKTTRASWKIAPQDVADVVMSILSMPERTLISRVEIRPSRPQKS